MSNDHTPDGNQENYTLNHPLESAIGQSGSVKMGAKLVLGAIAAIVAIGFLFGSKDNAPGTSTITEQAAKSSPSQKSTQTKTSSSVTAILGKKSLFTNIKSSGNIYCPADGPSWVIAELDGDFVAINGVARGWANKGDLSVYRGEKWITVKDQGVNPSGLKSDVVSEMIQTGLNLCPYGKGSPIDQITNRLEEGSARYIDIGSQYGLATEKIQNASPLGKKTVRINGFGCTDFDRFERILSLHGSGDEKAADRLLGISVVNQECVGFKTGDTVFVEDVSWSSSRCIRPEGETNCYWTVKAMVERD